MSSLHRAFAGAAVRWLMAIAGTYGVEIGNDQADALVNAVLVGGAILWSVWQKWQAHDRIVTAQLQAEVASRRP